MPETGPSNTLYQPLFAPRSIALIGASGDLTKVASRPQRFLREGGYRGALYLVNPNRETILGEPAWPDLAALPEVPEHAFILTSTDTAIDSLAECGRHGVRVATILASGFSESGAAGMERERHIRAIVRQTGIRVLGPNGLGIVNVHDRLRLTISAAFAEPDLPQGGVFCASHSGSMIGALISRGKERGVGFAGLVSVGNEVDLSIGEICSATLDDPNITGYLLFLETLRHSNALRTFAAGAALRGKPVIAYKLGRSAVAAELSMSHTGALAGEDDVANAFLKDCGIARVETLDALLEGLPLLMRLPPPPAHLRGRPPRVGLVTTTGGAAAMVVDQLGVRSIEVERPSDATFKRLDDAGIDVQQSRIVDLTLTGTRYATMKTALKILLSAPEFDLLVAVVGSSARFNADVTVRPIIESASGTAPLVAFVAPHAPHALALLTAAGVPAFRTPESCADVIAAAFGRQPPSNRNPSPECEMNESVDESVNVSAGTPLDEFETYALLDRIHFPHAPAVVVTAADVDSTVLPFAYPVAAKILSAKIPHKTDAGGVILGIGNETELKAAIKAIRESVARHTPDSALDRILVQPMVTGIGEVLLGYRTDPEIGPIVLLAAGGVLTEIYRDRSLRLAPVDRETAFEMISEVRMLKPLSGYRGKRSGDLNALADAIVALSKLAVMPGLAVTEVEINPLIVLEETGGVLAVDALAKTAAPNRPEPWQHPLATTPGEEPCA